MEERKARGKEKHSAPEEIDPSLARCADHRHAVTIAVQIFSSFTSAAVRPRHADFTAFAHRCTMASPVVVSVPQPQALL